jgi:phage-related protein
VDDFIRGLTEADQAKFYEVWEGIEANGLEFEGVEFKHLKGKLWEIKFRAPGGGYRVAYAVVNADEMAWLHAFKKTSQKTRHMDLSVAIKRMKDIL